MSVKPQCPLLVEVCSKTNKISAYYNKLNFHMLGHFFGSTLSLRLLRSRRTNVALHNHLIIASSTFTCFIGCVCLFRSHFE